MLLGGIALVTRGGDVAEMTPARVPPFPVSLPLPHPRSGLSLGGPARPRSTPPRPTHLSCDNRHPQTLLSPRALSQQQPWAAMGSRLLVNNKTLGHMHGKKCFSPDAGIFKPGTLAPLTFLGHVACSPTEVPDPEAAPADAREVASSVSVGCTGAEGILKVNRNPPGAAAKQRQ